MATSGGGGDDDLTNILNSLLDAGDIVDLMADVATAAFPMPPQTVMHPSLRQLSPEFQFPPAAASNNHRNQETEIPLVVSDPYLFEMPHGQSSMAPPPQMTVFWKGEQQPAKKNTSRSSDDAISSSSSTPSPSASRGSSPSITKIEELPDDQAVLKCPSPVSATQSRSMSRDSIAAEEPTEIVVPKEESTPESEMAAAESRYLGPNGRPEIDESANNNKCPVCHEKAGKHSYYGGRVCPSCRAFFRRAVQSKYYEIFFCTKGESCEINLTTRKSCQFCRFKKCLESGMRIAWVLPDGERHRRFNKLGKTTYRNSLSQQSQQESAPSRKVVIKQEPVPIGGRYRHRSAQMPLRIVLDMDDDIVALVTKKHTESRMLPSLWKAVGVFLHRNHAFIRELATAVYFGGKMDYEGYRSFNSLYSVVAYHITRGQEDFATLHPADQEILLCTNAAIWNQLRFASLLYESGCCTTTLLHKCHASGKFPELEELCDQFANFNVDEATKNTVMEYDMVFASPWQAGQRRDKADHYLLLRKMRYWLKTGGEESTVDDMQMHLMGLIIVFSTDFLHLHDRAAVERMQERYIDLLFRYLKAKYGREEAVKKMGHGMEMPFLARKANEIIEANQASMLCA